MSKAKKVIIKNGKEYLLLSETKEDFKLLNMSDGESIDTLNNLEKAGLLEIIEHKGHKYFRTIEPEESFINQQPFNVLR
ncbi:hypothetical protein DWB88_13600 (plasmid) [Staphylococcus warneri]|nr:hypothetical protein DWB88_13600 [Staphylococcus warneri]